MSILCAIFDRYETGIHIASDTMAVNGNEKVYHGPKWQRCGSLWIGSAGTTRVAEIIRCLGPRVTLDAEFRFLGIAKDVRDVIRAEGWKAREHEGGPPSYDVELIMTDGVSVATVSGNMTLTNHTIPDGYSGCCVTIGSGSEAARGVYSALSGRGLGPRETVREMVLHSINITRDCGGEVWQTVVTPQSKGMA